MRLPALLSVACLVGCATPVATPRDAAIGGGDALPSDAARTLDDAAAPSRDAGHDAPAPSEPCATRITYGSAWIHGAGHADPFDDVAERVTWDGVCHVDGGNSYAMLSNGWRPYFTGTSSCVLALDVSGACATPVPAACTTRITYGASWLRAPGHAADYDEVTGVVSWDGACVDHASGDSSALLSNGWAPYFGGHGACAISMRYEQCGGLFANPVVDVDCPDPGVVRDGARYVMACTGGDFALRTSSDLVHWTSAGAIFGPGRRPGWASGDFWAPEIHRVGDHWVAYFSARDAADGSLAIGAATAPTALGPFTDLGRPLVHDPHPGVIDAHHFEAPDGAQYLIYKVDGNATGSPTPIYAQPLDADGLTLVGMRTELIRNDQPWEGALVEGPWMIFEAGFYYLFYSANGYASTRYAIGVARARSPLGPFTKASGPILTSGGAFAGPGHGSVVVAPGGEWAHVFHAWRAGHVGEAPGRLVLAERITWADGWPHMFSAPSARSQPPL